jgi:hypothetical protein
MSGRQLGHAAGRASAARGPRGWLQRERGSPDADAIELGLSGGDYITDGSSLFHVEHTHRDRGSGMLLVEMENCVTLELSVWSADALAARPVRCVTPVGTPELSDAPWPESRDVPARARR